MKSYSGRKRRLISIQDRVNKGEIIFVSVVAGRYKNNSLRTRWAKARLTKKTTKEHICYVCKSIIPKGNKAAHRTIIHKEWCKYTGELVYYCEKCFFD